MGARIDGIDEVAGSNPAGSTNFCGLDERWNGDRRSQFSSPSELVLAIKNNNYGRMSLRRIVCGLHGAAFLFPLMLLFNCAPTAAQDNVRVVQVFVALADNHYQGIVPVPEKLGDGDAPASNLYWGAAYGVKTFFRASVDWEMVKCTPGPNAAILERCIFLHRGDHVYLVADAYEGKRIRDAVTDFLSAAAGVKAETLQLKSKEWSESIRAGGGSDLVAYVGHDAFMDFQLTATIAGPPEKNPRRTIVLACASKAYFAPYLEKTGAEPLLWTTGLMAPEAYTLKAALDGWVVNENGEAIRKRAAQAYDKYQMCGLRAAERLFTTGW